MTALTMARGDTKFVVETIQPVDAQGNQVLGVNGVQNWTFYMTAKFDAGDPDPGVFQKIPANWSVTTQGNLTTAAVVKCTINPTDTASLPPYQVVLAFDVTATDNSGNEFTIDSGTLTVSPDISLTP